jgi:hypothetical protein
VTRIRDQIPPKFFFEKLPIAAVLQMLF